LQLLLTGEMIDAQEAYRIGLVNRVVAATELLPVANEMMRAILANAPFAIANVIETVNRGYDATIENALTLEATAFGLLAATDDKREGTRAFLEKRPARFTGA
jgi:enoyl-CoA hydratase